MAAGPAAYIFGDWQLSTITTAQSGGPLGMQVVGGTTRLNSGNEQRPDRLHDGNLPSDKRSIYQWFDTSAFYAPPLYTFGTEETRTVIMPGLATVDLSLKKAFPMTERARLEFRAEFFNAFNRNNFLAPGNMIGSSELRNYFVGEPVPHRADELENRVLKMAPAFVRRGIGLAWSARRLEWYNQNPEMRPSVSASSFHAGGIKRVLLFPALCLASLCRNGLAVVDPDLPSPAPVVTGIFPHGLQRGTVAEVELSGQNLHDAVSVVFAGRGVSAEILASLGTSLKLRVTASKTAEVGRRDFRLTTARGVYVGVFDIGALPEIREVENNDDWRKPQSITLPVLVNGVIGNEDWDHFRFHAEAHETLIFDVSATRHGSRLDADIALLDLNGQELAWVDDTTIYGDPHLEYTFEKSGDYIVRVGSLAGGPNSDYRLSVGRLPYVSRTLPAGWAPVKPRQ